MKILYAGSLTENDTALYRLWALERLGHTVIPLAIAPYEARSAFLRKVCFRLSAGPGVVRLNRDLVQIAERERPDVFWADKMLWVWPETLDRLRAMGVVLVSYMIDNPFGTRNDPGWRLYMRDIPHYDLHVVQRDKNILDYRERGARDVVKIQTAYEPTLNFPPSLGWSDRDRDREVSFIGTPYDDRAAFLTRLWREHGLPVVISGAERLWRKSLDPEAFVALFRDGELYRTAYREAIWRSKINLSFITHGNGDEFVHKSFEIAGCGSFLAAERSRGHLERFEEDRDAVFFSDLEECAAKLRCWLPDEPGRERVAAAGHRRAIAGEYHNDGQMRRVVERVEGILGGLASRGRAQTPPNRSV